MNNSVIIILQLRIKNYCEYRENNGDAVDKNDDVIFVLMMLKLIKEKSMSANELISRLDLFTSTLGH